MSAMLLSVLQTALPWLPAGLWCAWWLWCVDWKQSWPVLANGGWVPVVLLTFVSALAWSQIFPTTCRCLGFSMPNFWWQLGSCTALVLVALLCGWLQERLGWTPAPVTFDPPEHHAHGHAHAHAHH